ncbi:MAG: phytoene desaturase family protein [Gemmatales bacterium]
MVAMRRQSVGIVGSGLAGLAAACTLAARGYAVTLFERNDWLGGKAAVHEQAGFRFDMGPTILTLPSVLKRIFAEAGRRLEDELELVPLDPQWRCFYSDHTTLDLSANLQKMKQTLQDYSPASVKGYEQFHVMAERLHRISERFYFWKPIGGIGDMMNFRESLQPAMLQDLLEMRFHKTVASTVRSFVPDERVAQMLDHFTQYVGSAPDQSPAVLCGIAHMQTSEGVWYPIGGTRAVPVALHQLARDLGVRFQTGCQVKQLTLHHGRVTGLVTQDGTIHRFDTVVSNMDSVRTHRELLAGTDVAAAFERKREYEPACSGVVLYLGLKQRYPQLLHHNFVFSADPHREFEDIYRHGIPAADPSCYVCAPAVTEPGVAPEGSEALYILVHTPYLRPGQNWKSMFPSYRRVIFQKLADVAGMTDLEERIVVEHHLTPQDIHDRYQVLNGAIYGLASHGKMQGGFKPNNRVKDVPGLYLAGGAAHPGPGMPMVMMSGWIAADAVDHDLRAA